MAGIGVRGATTAKPARATKNTNAEQCEQCLRRSFKRGRDGSRTVRLGAEEHRGEHILLLDARKDHDSQNAAEENELREVA